jgi:hypothetical protein
MSLRTKRDERALRKKVTPGARPGAIIEAAWKLGS